MSESVLSALYYFSFGISVAVYLWILFTKPSPVTTATNSSGTSNNSNANKKENNNSNVMRRLYLNVFFLDRTEVIHTIIRSKVSKSRPLIRALAKRAAVVLLKKSIVEKVAAGLTKPLVERLEAMGVKCAVNVAYAEASFACLEISFYNLDFHQFFVFNAGLQQADKITGLLDRFSLPAINEVLKKWMINFLYGKFMVQLPLTLKEKLYTKMNAEMEIIPCTEEEQSPFFIQTINQLSDETAKASNKTDDSRESE